MIGHKEGNQVDVAVSLMRVIDEADGSGTPEASLVRERLAASTMCRAGYSEEEIVGELGYLPEPFGRQAPETDMEAESISAPGMNHGPMEPCLLNDLPPASPEQEERALASRHAATHVHEEPGDSLETFQALMDLGREVMAKNGRRSSGG